MPIDTNGPKRTLSASGRAAAWFHRTGHSCIMPHFKVVSGGSANRAAVGQGFFSGDYLKLFL